MKIASSEKFFRNPGNEKRIPTIYFIDPINHPYVSPNGQVSVKALIKDREIEVENNRIETYVKLLVKLLRYPDLSDSDNAEDGKLLYLFLVL